MRIRKSVVSALMSLVLVVMLCPNLAFSYQDEENYGDQSDTYASGKWGTCPWEISSSGVLTVHPGKGSDTGKFGRGGPFVWHREVITKIVFKEENGEKVSAPSDFAYMFSDLKNVQNIDFSGLDTSAVRNMRGLFIDCKNLIAADLSKFDTRNVTNMSLMFSGCDRLTNLNLSTFNTSNVETMEGMFGQCRSLKSLNLSNFDTMNVTDMSSMFALGITNETNKSLGSGYESLDLSSFDTSHATKMDNMFGNCYALSQVKLGSKFSFKGATGSALCALPEREWQSSKTKSVYSAKKISEERNNLADTYTGMPVRILEGERISWEQGSSTGAQIKVSTNIYEFTQASVDKKIINSPSYILLDKDAVVVEFQPNYLNSLLVGEHSVEIETTLGMAKAVLSVRAKGTSQAMYRLYNPNSGEHLFTADLNEKNTLSKIGWKYENIAWTSPKSSKTPVYRLYNPNSGDHHYTKDLNEYDTLGKIGWRQEKVCWYSDDANGVPVYRLFNPNVKIGTHHYTTDKNEYDKLGKIGWKQEKVCWYGML